MKYRCRTLVPKRSEWFEHEGPTPEETANDFHDTYFHSLPSLTVKVTNPDDDTRYKVHFALVEVEGHGEMVSRIFSYGLWRRGGVPRNGTPTLNEQLTTIAAQLGWTHPPEDLIAEDAFDYVESMEEARMRADRRTQ